MGTDEGGVADDLLFGLVKTMDGTRMRTMRLVIWYVSDSGSILMDHEMQNKPYGTC